MCNLEFLGLLMNAVGTVLVLIYPPMPKRWEEDGSQRVEFKNNPLPHGVFKYWRQKTLGWVAIVLLVGGLSLQLYALGGRHCYFLLGSGCPSCTRAPTGS